MVEYICRILSCNLILSHDNRDNSVLYTTWRNKIHVIWVVGVILHAPFSNYNLRVVVMDDCMVVDCHYHTLDNFSLYRRAMCRGWDAVAI